jgi:hypothetical protein
MIKTFFTVRLSQMTAELESYCRHQDLLPMSPVASLLPRQRQQIILRFVS